jgi:hypothetical protein
MRQQEKLGRRRFLRTLGAAPAAAAAAAAVGLPSEAEAYDPGKEETKARYRPDSEDVKAFYRTNGYETLKK